MRPSAMCKGIPRAEQCRQIARLGGLAKTPKKALSSARNARKARDTQRAKNGALFGKVIPVELRPGYKRPPVDWSRFEAYREAEGWAGVL